MMRYMSATAPVSFRFSPEVKSLLEQAAAHDHRSQANFLESLILAYCSKNNISAAQQPKQSSKKGQK